MNELRMQKEIEAWQPASRSVPVAIVYGMLFSALIAVQVGMVGTAAATQPAQAHAGA